MSKTPITPSSPKPEHWDDREEKYYADYLFTQKVLMYVGSIGVAVGIVTLFVILCTLNATNKAAEAALAGVRPWLHVDNYKIPPITELESTPFKICVANLGPAPSTGVVIRTWLTYRGKDEEPPAMGVCPSKSAGLTYGSLGPKSQPFPYSTSEMETHYKPEQIQAIGRGDAQLFLHGCVHYALQGGEWRDTEFCARLYIPDRPPTETKTCGENVPAEIMK
jgi:hypothetical protein